MSNLLNISQNNKNNPKGSVMACSSLCMGGRQHARWHVASMKYSDLVFSAVLCMSYSYALRRGHCMLYVLYILRSRVVTKPSLCTSFSTACPSVSEKIGLSG